MTKLPKRPYLAPWYQLVKEEKRMLFKSGGSIIVVEGKASHIFLPALLPLLDGTRTLDEIHECIGEGVKPATLKALELLEQHGLLAEGYPINATKSVADLVNFFHSIGISQGAKAEDILESIQRAKIGIVGTGMAAEEIARLLKLSGVELIKRLNWQQDKQSFGSADLVVVAPQCKELYLLHEWNRFALDNHRSWIQVIPYDGRFAAVGPLYIPGETACYQCYEMRLASNVDFREELSDWNRAIDDRRISLSDYPVAPQISLMLSCLASLHVLCLITLQKEVSLVNLVNCFYAVEFGFDGVSLKQHHVYRVPRCPVCSRLVSQGSPLPWHEVRANE